MNWALLDLMQINFEIDFVCETSFVLGDEERRARATDSRRYFATFNFASQTKTLAYGDSDVRASKCPLFSCREVMESCSER